MGMDEVNALRRQKDSLSTKVEQTAAASMRIIVGPMVIVVGLVMGYIYYNQVKIESKLIKRNQAIIACQDRFNDYFAEVIKRRFDLSTARKDSFAELLTGVGNVIADSRQGVGSTSDRADAISIDYDKYRILFSEFAEREQKIKRLRDANPLPEYPECLDRVNNGK